VAKKIGSLLVDLGLDTTRLETGIKKSQNRFKRFEKTTKRTFNKINQSVNGLAGNLIALAGIGSLTMVAKQSLDAADNIQKLAIKTGISTEALSELQFAAEQSGVEFGTVDKAIQNMVRTVSEARDGVATYADAYNTLGINVDALAKLSPEKQIEVMADAFNNLDDQTTKTAVAMDIFGGRGTQMIQMFSNGSEGIRELRGEAKELGRSLSQDAADKAADANDAMNRFTSSMRGVSTEFVTNMAPALTNLADGMSVQLPGAMAAASEAFFLFRQNGLTVIAFLAKKWSEFAGFMGGILGGNDTAEQIKANLKKIEELQSKNLKNMHFRQQRAHKARLKMLQEETDDLVAGDTFGQMMIANAAQAEMFEQALLKTAAAAQRDAESFATAGGSVREYNAAVSDLVDRASGGDDGSSILPPMVTEEEIDKAQVFTDKMTNNLKVIGESGKSVFGQLRDNFSNMVNDMVTKWVGSQITNLFMSLVGGVGGGLMSSFLPTFANGGSFTVGGKSGTDSNLVAFRATKGETVSVNRQGESGGGGGAGVVINNQYDFSGSSMQTAEVEGMIERANKVQRLQIQNDMARRRF